MIKVQDPSNPGVTYYYDGEETAGHHIYTSLKFPRKETKYWSFYRETPEEREASRELFVKEKLGPKLVTINRY